MEAGETPQEALRREWVEECAVEVTVGALLSSRMYETPGYPHPYRVRAYLITCGGEPTITQAGGQRGAWWPIRGPQPTRPFHRLLPSNPRHPRNRWLIAAFGSGCRASTSASVQRRGR